MIRHTSSTTIIECACGIYAEFDKDKMPHAAERHGWAYSATLGLVVCPDCLGDEETSS